MKKQTGNQHHKGSMIKRYSLEDFLEGKYNRFQAVNPVTRTISWLDRRSALKFANEWINDQGGRIKLLHMSMTELQKIRRECCRESQTDCIRVIDSHLKTRAQGRNFIMKDHRDEAV